MSDTLRPLEDCTLGKRFVGIDPGNGEAKTVNTIILPTNEWRELTGEDICNSVKAIQDTERQRCIALIREHIGVYTPGYRLDKLIEAIEKGE